MFVSYSFTLFTFTKKQKQISLICEDTDTCDWSRYGDYTVIANALKSLSNL